MLTWKIRFSVGGVGKTFPKPHDVNTIRTHI